MQRIVVWLIRRYQSRGGGARLLVACNFTPSCSEYSLQALEKYGLLRGGRVAMKRIRRCHHRDQVGTISDPLP